MFTSRPLFDDRASDEEVMTALTGEAKLPYEAFPALWDNFNNSDARQLVEGLLQRRPEQRISAAEALGLCHNLYL